MEQDNMMKDWLENLMACQSCHLRQEGNRGPTRYTGNITSPLMFVGEGPGGVEDEYGVPLDIPLALATSIASVKCSSIFFCCSSR